MLSLRPNDWIDRLLLAAIVLLTTLLAILVAWPVLDSWMNRPRPGEQVAVRYTSSARAQHDPAPLDHLFYLPKAYGGDSRLWPLVVFLHGAAEQGDNVSEVARMGPPRLAAEGQDFPMILISPQCPTNRGWAPNVLLILIDHVTSRYRVDTERIYVTGYSMGGFGTWRLASAAPDRFAAAAPLCGGGALDNAKKLKHLPLWVFHGELDDVVPVKASQEMVDAVRAAGGNVVFTVYPGEGHGICDRTYARNDFWQWLLKQRRPSNSSEPANANTPP